MYSSRRDSIGSAETLVILPCSGTKSVCTNPLFSASSSSSVEELVTSTKERLSRGRAGKAGTIMWNTPKYAAFDYYDGQLYKASGFRTTVGQALLEGKVKSIILSGGYGVVLHNEFIHDYDAYMEPDYWLEHGLGDVIAEVILILRVKRVYAFLTSNYRVVLRGVPWETLRESLDEAGLFIAEKQGSGTPYKLGQAARRFVELGLDREALIADMRFLTWQPLLHRVLRG